MKTHLSKLGRLSIKNAERPQKESENFSRSDTRGGQQTRKKSTSQKSKSPKDAQAYWYLPSNIVKDKPSNLQTDNFIFPVNSQRVAGHCPEEQDSDKGVLRNAEG